MPRTTAINKGSEFPTNSKCLFREGVCGLESSRSVCRFTGGRISPDFLFDDTFLGRVSQGKRRAGGQRASLNRLPERAFGHATKTTNCSSLWTSLLVRMTCYVTPTFLEVMPRKKNCYHRGTNVRK